MRTVLALASVCSSAFLINSRAAAQVEPPPAETTPVISFQTADDGKNDAANVFEHDATPGFELSLNLGVYLSRASGDVSFGAGEVESFTLENALELDDLEPSLAAELLFRMDRLDVALSGFDFSTDGSMVLDEGITFGGLTLATGERVEASFDLFTAGIDVRYAFLPPPDDDRDVVFRIAPSLGLRYVDLDQSITSAAGVRERVSPSATAIMPGVWMEMAFRETLFLTGGVSYGPNLDGGSQMVIGASVAWHPVRNIGLSFGYRQLDFVLDEDDYEVDGRIAGLFIAGSVKF